MDLNQIPVQGDAASDCILEARSVCKTYQEGSLETTVLQGVDFSLKKAERVAILGASGSGKSTLLHLLAGLDVPSSGQVSLMGRSWSAMTPNQRGLWRNQHLGMIYQFHHLLPEFTALENVAMPLLIRGASGVSADREASVLLEKVGLSHRLAHKPAELSGGERQRVAVARALITSPSGILADEPTGNLDRHHAASVCEVILELNQSYGVGVVLVTHDQSLAAKMDRVYHLIEGRLQET